MIRYAQYLSIVVLSVALNNPLYAQPEHDSTALGAIIGTVVGGVIGHQFGGGSGKYVSTAVGAAIGSTVGRNIHHNQNHKNDYQSDYQNDYVYPVNDDRYPTDYHRQPIYVYQDDYLIKQELSDARKRRNMIRNGEIELPYDVSNVQTSWDDPDN